jgi:RNA polymerase sigma-70 factor, ECF subfamily
MGDLGERLARGDQAAFAEVYEACADRLHHYLVVRLGSRDDADDILQETFVRLARMRTSLAGVYNVTAYVFTVARNEAARLLGQKSRQGRAMCDAGALFCEAASDETQARDAADTVTAALAQLTMDEREIVTLKINAGLGLREIAEVTGLPQGTVATRYRTAIGRLRNWFMRKCHER